MHLVVSGVFKIGPFFVYRYICLYPYVSCIQMCRRVPCKCMQKPDIRCCPLPCASWSLTEPEAHLSARLTVQWALRIHRSLSPKDCGYRLAKSCLSFCMTIGCSTQVLLLAKEELGTLSHLPSPLRGHKIVHLWIVKHKSMKTFKIYLKCLVIMLDFE